MQGVSSLTTQPTGGSTVALTSSVGTYTGAIIFSGGVADNYSFSYVAADVKDDEVEQRADATEVVELTTVFVAVVDSKEGGAEVEVVVDVVDVQIIGTGW